MRRINNTKNKNCYTVYGNFNDFCYSGKNDTPRLFVRIYVIKGWYNNVENCILCELIAHTKKISVKKCFLLYSFRSTIAIEKYC